MNIKENLAKNLTAFRKAYNLTQAELAEKINYSDKAVSKWERGEAVPDLVILKQLADLYDTKIDNLIEEPKEEKPTIKKVIPKKRLIISLLAFGLVWVITMLTYSLVGILLPSFHISWLIFIYAIPISTTLFLIFSTIWGKNLVTSMCLTILNWSIALSIYLSLKLFISSPPHSLWLIFLICIPIQLLIILWIFYKKLTFISKHVKKNK